jgi:hypothetical protein
MSKRINHLEYVCVVMCQFIACNHVRPPGAPLPAVTAPLFSTIVPSINGQNQTHVPDVRVPQGKRTAGTGDGVMVFRVSLSLLYGRRLVTLPAWGGCDAA